MREKQVEEKEEGSSTSKAKLLRTLRGCCSIHAPPRLDAAWHAESEPNFECTESQPELASNTVPFGCWQVD